MKSYVLPLALALLFEATATAQAEFYVKLSDPDHLTRENAHGIVLKSFRAGQERYTSLLFRPGQDKVYFVPLDTATRNPQAVLLLENALEEGTELRVQFLGASGGRNCPPQSAGAAPRPRPFLLSDGDLLVVEVVRTGSASAR